MASSAGRSRDSLCSAPSAAASPEASLGSVLAAWLSLPTASSALEPRPGAEADAQGRLPQDARLVEVAPLSGEWLEVDELLQGRSEPYLKHYDFRMGVSKLWKVQPGRVQRQHREAAQRLGGPTLLFHGTSRKNVDSILQAGFRLPERGGMFGPGIYFADCPLKSVGFSRPEAWDVFGPEAVGCLSGAAVGGLAAGAAGCCCLGAGLGLCGGCCLGASLGHASRKLVPTPNQKMLVCEVFLGTSWTLRLPMQVKPEEHFQRGRLMRALGAQDYNSVSAPGGLFCAVSVPEYVVYEPCQAIPKYVIEFTCDKLDGET